MRLRLPQNQAVTSKYTSGKEYMFVQTYKEYIGYYYELNSKLFAGKEFNFNAPELIKIDSSKVNKLLTNPATYVYGKISGISIPNQKPISHVFQYDSNIRYFAYNNTKKLIKEVTKESFESLQSNPIYATVSLSYKDGFDDNELKQAESTVPGIKTFADTSYTNTPTDGEDIDPNTIIIPSSINPVQAPTSSLATSSITDTPKPQDIVPVGPIYEKGAIFIPPLT